MLTQRNKMNITYRELLEKLKQLPSERLDDNVTVYDVFEEEFYPVQSFRKANDNEDVVDPTQHYMVF